MSELPLNPTPEISVFYDGNCPMCGREISYYKGRRGAESIEWVDINTAPEKLEQAGLAREQAMARLHVQDSNNQWYTGAYGFARMWQQLTVFRPLAWLLRTSRLLHPLDKLYSHFAAWRVKRLAHKHNGAMTCSCSQGFQYNPAERQGPLSRQTMGYAVTKPPVPSDS